jgi:hypothetical protein
MVEFNPLHSPLWTSHREIILSQLLVHGECTRMPICPICYWIWSHRWAGPERDICTEWILGGVKTFWCSLRCSPKISDFPMSTIYGTKYFLSRWNERPEVPLRGFRSLCTMPCLWMYSNPTPTSVTLTQSQSLKIGRPDGSGWRSKSLHIVGISVSKVSKQYSMSIKIWGIQRQSSMSQHCYNGIRGTNLLRIILW